MRRAERHVHYDGHQMVSNLFLPCSTPKSPISGNILYICSFMIVLSLRPCCVPLSIFVGLVATVSSCFMTRALEEEIITEDRRRVAIGGD